ncbi:MAG: hypothetical protein WBB66_04955, partial [Candidatus Omnitrophota bacterium]
KAGEYRALLEELTAVRGLFRRRYELLDIKIRNVISGRLTELRGMVNKRNKWMMGMTRWMLDRLDKGNKNIGGAIKRVLGDNSLKEPEFGNKSEGMYKILGAAETAITEGNVEEARKNIVIFRERVRLMSLLNAFMRELRDESVKARYEGKPRECFDELFEAKFDKYLKIARERNIGRGSPVLLWVTCYLAAYVSMDVKKDTRFEPLQTLIYVLEFNELSELVKWLGKAGNKTKFRNSLKTATKLKDAGREDLNSLTPGENKKLVKALSRDLSLYDKEVDKGDKSGIPVLLKQGRSRLLKPILFIITLCIMPLLGGGCSLVAGSEGGFVTVALALAVVLVVFMSTMRLLPSGLSGGGFELNPDEKLKRLKKMFEDWSSIADCYRDLGLDPQREEDKALIIEAIKRYARRDARIIAEHFLEFGLDPVKDKAEIIEIAKIVSSYDGEAGAEHFEKFGLDPATDKDEIFNIAKFCARSRGRDTAKYFKNFGFDPKTDMSMIIEIAKLCAMQNAIM